MDSESRSALWTRRNVLRALGGLVTLLAAGTLTARGGASAKGKTVKMAKEMTFEPALLTIKVGDSVTWTNDNDMVHTATADPSKVRDATLIEIPAGAQPWDSGYVGRGQSWKYTFTTPGTYRYVCVPHVIVGMTGQITVEP